MKRALTYIGCGLSLGAIMLACSGSIGPDRGGLIVTLSNDGTLQLDHFTVQVAEGDQVLFQNQFAISSTQLPNTISIVSNGTPTTTATVSVSAWLNGVAVDRRDAIITQIPADRVASLDIMLSGQCTQFVTAGTDPTTAVSTCPQGQTCTIAVGHAQCGSDSVDASTLPSYAPGAAVGSGSGGGNNSDSGAPLADGGAPACAENALQCDALQPQTCTGGAWQNTGSACEYVCTKGKCAGECSPGTAKCSANGVVTCGADSTWGVAVACPANTPECNGAGICGVCTQGAKQCGGSGTQTCNSIGQWDPANACPGATPFCNGAGLCGVCNAGDSQCVGTSSSVELCGADGNWGAATACSNACVSGACTGVCAPGSTQCSNTVPQSCNSVGSWVNGPIVAGTCTAICTPNATRCNGAVPQTCNGTGTAWQSGAVMANQCGAVCTPGQNMCVSGTYNETCQANGTWGSAVITVGVCGAVCNPTSQRCVNPDLQTCQANGLWNSGVVTGGQCGAVCTPGQKGCLNTSQGSTLCTGPSSCWWVWTTEAIYDETCNSVGQWGPQNQCTGECAGTNGQSYYNCDANNGGCIPAGQTCSQK